jgi:hypothetical protein
VASTSQRFRFSYGGLGTLLTVMGLGQGLSRIEVSPVEVVVRMGWGFRARVPRRSITRAYEEQGRKISIGIHGFRGRWLVNGSSFGIVTIDVEPSCRAIVMGLYPVKVTQLQVSAEDPSGLVAAIGPR